MISVNSEISDVTAANGWLFFDAHCSVCRALVRRFQNILRRRHIHAVPLQTPWVRQLLQLSEQELLAEVRLLTRNGRVLGGADAVLEIAKQIWWARPVYWLDWVPGGRRALRRAYNAVARKRYCIGDRCSTALPALPRRSGWMKWLPGLCLPLLAWLSGRRLPGWEFMWAMAGGLFLGAKWITLFPLLVSPCRVKFSRLFGYLLLWPGMDPETFCAGHPAAKPRFSQWVLAGAKIAFGAGLLWLAVPALGPNRPLVTGWTGMVAIVFLLHFGIFHLLSLTWRTLGIDAPPLMRWPVGSTSLTEFWGCRWNRAFSDLMNRHALRQMAHAVGSRPAMVSVFALSGVLHELVISVPAGGGYGLPTGYFALQSLGLLLERSLWGKKFGLGSGWAGRFWLLAIAGLPCFWLFPPIFVRHVVLPMLKALGAT